MAGTHSAAHFAELWRALALCVVQSGMSLRVPLTKLLAAAAEGDDAGE